MSYITQLLILICLYAILAQSLNLIVGYAGLLSFCHAAFFGLGAYISAILMIKIGVPFAFAFIISVVAVGVLAWLVSYLSIRLSGDFFVLSTLGFQTVIYSLLYNWEEVTAGKSGLSGIPRPSIFSYSIRTQTALLIFIIIFTILTLGVIKWIAGSPFGRTLQAIRDDEMAAVALGKNVNKFKRSVFLISGGVAAVAGVLFATFSSYIDPTSFGLSESLFILSILIIGGAGNMKGPLVGAVALVLLPELLRFMNIQDNIAANLRQIIYGLALILMMRWRPQGLAGNYAFD
jgi:branched-chain amino acid transport system permease protein